MLIMELFKQPKIRQPAITFFADAGVKLLVVVYSLHLFIFEMTTV